MLKMKLRSSSGVVGRSCSVGQGSVVGRTSALKESRSSSWRCGNPSCEVVPVEGGSCEQCPRNQSVGSPSSALATWVLFTGCTWALGTVPLEFSWEPMTSKGDNTREFWEKKNPGNALIPWDRACSKDAAAAPG